MKNQDLNLEVKRSTFITDWSYTRKDGSIASGTQNNQCLKLVDSNGKVYSDTSTITGSEDDVIEKVGFLVIRTEDDRIMETGWTVNEKSIKGKWFKKFVKDGSYSVVIGRLK
jgi:hypothetical protein